MSTTITLDYSRRDCVQSEARVACFPREYCPFTPVGDLLVPCLFI